MRFFFFFSIYFDRGIARNNGIKYLLQGFKEWYFLGMSFKQPFYRITCGTTKIYKGI